MYFNNVNNYFKLLINQTTVVLLLVSSKYELYDIKCANHNTIAFITQILSTGI